MDLKKNNLYTVVGFPNTNFNMALISILIDQEKPKYWFLNDFGQICTNIDQYFFFLCRRKPHSQNQNLESPPQNFFDCEAFPLLSLTWLIPFNHFFKTLTQFVKTCHALDCLGQDLFTKCYTILLHHIFKTSSNMS